MAISRELLQSMANLILKNPALATAVGMDEVGLKIVMDMMVDFLSTPKPDDEKELEAGEFFLLKWNSDKSKFSLPQVEGRFLSRTCALEAAKMLNRDNVARLNGVSTLPECYYDVASVQWLAGYKELMNQQKRD